MPRALSQSQGLEAPQTTLLVPEVVSAPQSAPALKGLGSPEINTESKGGWWDGLFRSAVKAAGVLGLAVVVVSVH